MKLNYLESTKPLYKGKNIHELVSELKQELSNTRQKGFVSEDTKTKLNVLYETKEMNPPYFFSWEFTMGTYLPLLAPFMSAVLTSAWKLFKESKASEKEKKEKAEADSKEKRE